MWGPTASCPGCSKKLSPHCESSGCPWGRCASCGLVWSRKGRAIEDPHPSRTGRDG